MRQPVEFQSTIANGLPVTIKAVLLRGDSSVGEFGYLVDDLTILDAKGRHAPWAERRASASDRDRLRDEALSANA